MRQPMLDEGAGLWQGAMVVTAVMVMKVVNMMVMVLMVVTVMKTKLDLLYGALTTCRKPF